ncbi:MAG: hypothetical protein OXB96_01590 [Candidatus Kaiserbacteria bacterium]|nr:hypothetical protein [Candidatus Kaiserbacteria bacterium]
MTPTKRFTIATIVFLVFFALLFAGIYVYFSSEPPAPKLPPAEPTGPATPSLGLENLGVQPSQIPFSQPILDDETGQRDDRVRTAPLSSNTGDASTEDKENTPRLIRLFKGPTAGYRIAKKGDRWEVQVVEQGRGNRYIVQTIPYTLTLAARGEFTRTIEGYPFESGEALILYESADDEGVIRSAFVPFSTIGTGPSVQRFEDNIRVATNNKNLLFFMQVIENKSVGVVVDVANPSETRVVWRSDFTSWIPRWGNSPRITLHTPVTNLMKGFVYLVDPKGILPNEQFTSLNSGGSAFMDATTGYFAVFETKADNFAGKTYITNRERSTMVDLPITLPEKCDAANGIFICAAPRAIPARTLSGYETMFPDSWYQGDITFSDVIVSVNAATGEKRLLLSPDQEEIQILSDNAVFDIMHPQLSPDGEFLFFVNKYDMSLWMLQIEGGV